VSKFPVLTKLSGGLGNQIYGLCNAWIISLMINRKILLEPILVDNPQYVNRVFDVFEIDFTTAVEERISKKGGWSAVRSLLIILSKAARRDWIPGIYKFDEDAELIPGSIKFCAQIQCDSRLAAKARAIGFPKIVGLKNPSLQYLSLELETHVKQILAVHLRLTDIRSFESGNRMLSPNYFARNIEMIYKQKSIEEVWVFSDEPNAIPDFIPSSFKIRSISSTSSLTVCEELVLMSKCSALLGSRSTFSFWACFWNSNQNSIYYPGEVDGFAWWHNSLI
jgi:hypothetical protein